MALKSTFTPKASLSDAPTNLKEAIDWVLRVTGKDGKALNKETECICGLAAAVTDLLQSVTLEYHGYQGETKGTETTANKGASAEKVKEHLNGLFSLVQGLGGTAVVRTYIDQLAQVLSALVGWSRIKKCDKGSSTCQKGSKKHHGLNDCQYLKDKEPENNCETCGCIKWDVPGAEDHTKGHHLGRRCTRCSEEAKKPCECNGGCKGNDACECALAGKCCKCCCSGSDCKDKCKKKGCSCDGYKSAYQNIHESWIDGKVVATWTELKNDPPGIYHPRSITAKHHQCAQILLGSVCLIWSGITYMYWTGKYAESSPRWNNHILDGSGLDDGTLSQWLQALGFPREMLNNSGPKNRLDKVIWDGIMDKLYLGFPDTGNWNNGVHSMDSSDNTFRQPAGMNFAGYIHTLEKGAFDKEGPFKENGKDINKNKLGALFKLYILSCAYFTGLQQKAPPKADNRTPKTIREILYWLSALPYSPAYKDMLGYGKGRLQEVLKKPGETESSTGSEQKQLKFYQEGRNAPITVDEYNLFAHFQAVTQYCPLVLIGIQGGLGKSADSTKEPAIHSLYANTECQFTYPAVPIQAYNQVVHYIRGLFYQLYFLRKQCAVKVALGGKWRECRYGNGVLGKGVISWMCLGCNPMEHDRKWRVTEMGKKLVGVKTGDALKKTDDVDDGSESEETKQEDELAKELNGLLDAIGDVVVQLGNAQEALERKEKDVIEKVKEQLKKAKGELEAAREGLGKATDIEFAEALGNEELERLMGKDGKAGLLGELTNGGGALHTLVSGNGTSGSLQKVASSKAEHDKEYSTAKDKIREAINGVRNALELLKEWVDKEGEKQLNGHKYEFTKAIKDLISICNSPKCPSCKSHSTKCGQKPTPTVCRTCHQQYMDGTPSPLQAFLEDRLPGFSCTAVPEGDNPEYPLASSHLYHSSSPGQCCPLPMGFRGNFYKGSISDMTGKRLYGILYFFSNEKMMQSCVYTLVRVTAELSATTPQVLGDVFGFFRGGVGNKESGKTKNGQDGVACQHQGDPSNDTNKNKYFCGWCASGLRDEVKKIEWIQNAQGGHDYRTTVGTALIQIKGDKGTGGVATYSSTGTTTTSLSTLTKDSEYLSPLTGELYTAVSATFGHVYLSWVLYLSDALEGGLRSLASAFKEIECNSCKGQCDPNKCKKGSHGASSDGQCGCQSIVSCTGVLPVLYRHGFSYGNPFNLEGYQQNGKESGDYSIENKHNPKHCHEFLESLKKVIEITEKEKQDQHPLTNLLSQVGKLQYDIRLPWIFVLTLAWLVAVLYLAFGAIWPLDWTHMRSHWLRGGEHQWQCMWYKVMTGRKGRVVLDAVEYFGRR